MRSFAALGQMVTIPASVSMSMKPDDVVQRKLNHSQGLEREDSGSTANSICVAALSGCAMGARGEGVKMLDETCGFIWGALSRATGSLFAMRGASIAATLSNEGGGVFSDFKVSAFPIVSMRAALMAALSRNLTSRFIGWTFTST